MTDRDSQTKTTAAFSSRIGQLRREGGELGQTEFSVKGAIDVLILQADRLGSGNMRVAIHDVFPDSQVGIARTGSESIAALESRRFDLAVFGLGAADLAWMDDFGRILELLEGTPVLAISGRQAPRTFRLLTKLRFVSLFDPVTQGPMELRRALETVIGRRRYLSPSIESLLQDSREPRPELLLSAAEEKVLSLIGDGSDDDEAAAKLSLARSTLATHRRNIMRKLGLHHRGELVRFAIKHGYVTRKLDGSLVPGLVSILTELGLSQGRA